MASVDDPLGLFETPLEASVLTPVDDDPLGLYAVSTPTPKPEFDLVDAGQDVVRGGLRGAMNASQLIEGVAALPINLLTRAYNAAEGAYNAPEGEGASAAWDAFKQPSFLERSIAERYQKARDTQVMQPEQSDYPLIKGVSTVAELGTEALGMGGIFGGGNVPVSTAMRGVVPSKLAPAASPTQLASQQAIREAELVGRTAVGSAAGGAGLEAYADQQGADSDLYKTIGSITGAFGGDVQGMQALGKALWGGLKSITRAPQKIMSVVRGGGDTVITDATANELRLAVAEIARQAYPDDPTKLTPDYLDSLVQTVADQITAGKPPTTIGLMTGDTGILAFEQRMADEATKVASQRVNRQHQLNLKQNEIAGRADAAVDSASPVGDMNRALEEPKAFLEQSRQAELDTAAGRAADLTEQSRLVESQAAETKAAADQASLQAQGAQQAAATPLEVAPSAPQASSNLRAATETVRQQRKGEMQSAWRKLFETEMVVPSDQVKRAVDMAIHKITKGSPDTMRTTVDAFKRDFKQELDDIAALEGGIDVEDISNLISRVTQSQNATGQVRSFASTFKDELYDAMLPAGASQADRRAAAKLTRDYYESFGKQTQVGRALDTRDASFGGATMGGGEELAVDRFNEIVRASRNDPQVMADAEDYLRGLFKRKLLRGVEGVPKSDAIQNEIARYTEQLDAFPALKQEMDNLLNTSLAAEAAQSGTKTASAASKKMQSEAEALRDMAQGELKGGQQRASAVDQTPVGKFASREQEQETMFRAAKKAVEGDNPVEDIKAILASASTPEGKSNLQKLFFQELRNSVEPDGRLTPTALKKFRSRRNIYEKSGLFTREQLDTFEEGMVEGQKMFAHTDAAKKIAALAPEEQVLLNMVSSVLGAKAGAWLLGSPLIGAAIGRKGGVAMSEGLRKRRIEGLAFDLAMKPDKFKDIVEELANTSLSEAAKVKLWKKLLIRAGITAPQYADEE